MLKNYEKDKKGEKMNIKCKDAIPRIIDLLIDSVHPLEEVLCL